MGGFIAPDALEAEPLPFCLDDLLLLLAQRNGSDLHLTSGLPPMARVDGDLQPLSEMELGPFHTRSLTYEALSDDQVARFEQKHELDCSYSVKNVGRFRVSVYRQRDSVAAAFRAIPSTIPTLDDLRLPATLGEVSRRSTGLVLVTGPTGVGKSTTLAALVDLINTSRACHILTLEDPIEYLHSHKRSMVNQREIGSDTDSFHAGLRAVLREDPDVVLVGEMRDLETIGTALTLAETGHLVLATLHTRDTAQAIDRIVDVFPSHQQQQIRVQLSGALEMIVAQQLLPKVNGGRIVAYEILFATSAVRNLVREGKTHQILTVIETSAQSGMISMDKCLARLVRQGQVVSEQALLRCTDADNFNRLLRAG